MHFPPCLQEIRMRRSKKEEQNREKGDTTAREKIPCSFQILLKRSTLQSACQSLIFQDQLAR